MTGPMCSKCGLPIGSAELKRMEGHNRKSLKLVCPDCWMELGIMEDDEYMRLDLFIIAVSLIIVVLVLLI